MQCFRSVDIAGHFAFVSMSNSDVDTKIWYFEVDFLLVLQLPQPSTIKDSLGNPDGGVKGRSSPRKHISTARVRQFPAGSKPRRKVFFSISMTLWIFGTEWKLCAGQEGR